jgi:hypothetical protein
VRGPELAIGACLLLLTGLARGPETDAMHTLDLQHRTIRQRIGPELDRPTQQKFVEIQIAAIVNPRRIRITFDVAFQPDEGEKVPLGSFAPFPPDNPGRFIVATGGKLRNEGAIVLSMAVLDETGPDDALSVTVKRISFREK